MQVKLHFLPLETSWVLESRVRFMYEMQHFVHNFPLTREQGLLRDFLVFSHLCRKKWNFEPILKFVGSNFEWVLTLVSKNRWVLTIRPSVYIYISINTTNKLWRKHTQTHQYGVPHVGNTIGKEYKATYLFHPFSILYDTLHDSGTPKVVPLVDSSMVEGRIKRWETHLSSYCDEKKHDINTQTFNVWYTYLHLLNFHGKCR